MAARGWNNWTIPKRFGSKYNVVTRERYVAVLEELLCTPFDEVETIGEYGEESAIVRWIARSVVRATNAGDYYTLDKLMDRVIGKTADRVELANAVNSSEILSFEDFCIKAGYPAPYRRQVEMMEFGINQGGAKMILGARGYGKTDYVVLLGIAYAIYLDKQLSFLIVTKSDERNAAMLAEIHKAASTNGVIFEKQNASCLRVAGAKGKDHSVSAITIGSCSIRGRHPKKIILDDPVTEDDVSEATRRKVQRVYNELTKLTSDILIIGQPVHKFDLYETLRPILNRLELPHGSIPELDHDLVAQRLAGVSEESIQASYFLKVVSEAGFPLEKVKFLEDFPSGDSIAFIDPSFEGGDYTALSVVKAHFDGVAVKGRLWKRAWYNCLDDIAKELKKCNVRRVCFETNALGDQPVVMLRDLLDGVGVVGRKSTGHKHSRIIAIGPFAELIHIAKTSDRLYVDQIVKYEYGAEHDDAPDSLASALNWIGLIRGRE